MYNVYYREYRHKYVCIVVLYCMLLTVLIILDISSESRQILYAMSSCMMLCISETMLESRDIYVLCIVVFYAAKYIGDRRSISERKNRVMSSNVIPRKISIDYRHRVLVDICGAGHSRQLSQLRDHACCWQQLVALTLYEAYVVLAPV